MAVGHEAEGGEEGEGAGHRTDATRAAEIEIEIETTTTTTSVRAASLAPVVVGGNSTTRTTRPSPDSSSSEEEGATTITTTMAEHRCRDARPRGRRTKSSVPLVALTDLEEVVLGLRSVGREVAEGLVSPNTMKQRKKEKSTTMRNIGYLIV